jgi:hypothetical protein
MHSTATKAQRMSQFSLMNGLLQGGSTASLGAVLLFELVSRGMDYCG